MKTRTMMGENAVELIGAAVISLEERSRLSALLVKLLSSEREMFLDTMESLSNTGQRDL